MQAATVISPRARGQWSWARAGEPPGSGSLQDLAAWLDGQDGLGGPGDVVLLVPGEDVLLARVSMPTRNPGRIARALPFALEEHVLGDPSGLHCVPGPWADQETLCCAAIDRQRLAKWLAELSAQGITPDRACPDMLCLPWTEGAIQVTAVERRAMVRWGPASALTGDASSLDAMVEGVRAGHGLAGEAIERQQFAREEDFIASCASHTEAVPLNLLQGEFLPRQRRAGWQSWRLPAALAAGMLLSWALLEGFQNRGLDRQSDALSDAISTQFRSTFPHIGRVQSDPGPQVELELRRLRQDAGADGDQFLTLLARVAPALSASPGLSLERLQFSDGRLELGITAGEIAELDRLRTRLVAAGISASQGAVRLDNNRVSGTITIARGPGLDPGGAGS